MKAVDIVLNPGIRGESYGFSKLIYAELLAREISKKAGAVIINEEKYDNARKIIDKLYGKVRLIIINAGDNEFNRKSLENKKINFLLNPHEINHVLCRIAKQNNITILLSLPGLIEEKGLKIARENIRFCKKYGTKIKLVSLAEKQEDLRDSFSIRSLCMSLGMTTKMALDAMESY